MGLLVWWFEQMNRQQNQSKAIDDDVIRSIAGAVNSLQFGEVHITVHDSRIVRIDRIERIRLDSAGRPAKGLPLQGGDES